MHFAEGEDGDKLDTVIEETNETYERFLISSRDQNDGETIEQYDTALRTLCQTCNFCSALQNAYINLRYMYIVVPGG